MIDIEPQGAQAPETAVRPAAWSWRPWFLRTALAGVGVGLLWWLAAPGGAFYGDATAWETWLPRDAVLGAAGVVAGLVCAVLLVRSFRRSAAGTTARLAATLAGALLGSVLAWRTGVFAGDLFHTPPSDMADPSMVFSLRAGVVLLLWPLATTLAVFLWGFASLMFSHDGRGSLPASEFVITPASAGPQGVNR